MPLLKNSGRGVSWFSVEGTSINDVRRFLRRFLRFFWPPSSPNLNLQQLDQPTLFWHFLKKITTTGWSANSQIKWTGLILMIHTTYIFVFFVPTSSLHWWFCDVWTKKKTWSRIHLSLYESLTFWISLRLFDGSRFTMIFFFSSLGRVNLLWFHHTNVPYF